MKKITQQQTAEDCLKDLKALAKKFVSREGIKQMAQLISTWEELAELPPESETHVLRVGDCNGWIHRKGANIHEFGHYLSTHTFYGSEYKRSTAILQSCGFDVEIDNWDKED